MGVLAPLHADASVEADAFGRDRLRGLEAEPFAERRRVKLLCVAQGRLLVLRNPDGSWDLPGGGARRRESDEQALRREIDEELGLVLPADTAFVGAWDRIRTRKPRVLVHFYQTRQLDPAGTIRLSDEHIGHDWLDMTALMSLPMAGGYRRAALKALRGVGDAEVRNVDAGD